MSEEQEKLVDLLQRASEAYYNEQPILSDAEFDALREELQEIAPGHPFLSQVGAPPSKKWPNVPHGIPMGSLNKVTNADELNDWYRGVVLTKAIQASKYPDRLILSEKLDGISLSLRYEGGRLQQAVTRGDGATGLEITRNARMFKGVPEEVSDFSGFIRGEVVLRKSDLLNCAQEYKSLRNAANGIAKRESDPKDCRHLTFKAFQVVPTDPSVQIYEKGVEFELLEKLGFQTPSWRVGTTHNDVLDWYGEYQSQRRGTLDYEIDGLVVELNDLSLMEAFGASGGCPKGAVALKFPHEEQVTRLKEVVWEIGASGRATPVAHFDEVRVAGVDVSRASLHNWGLVDKLGICIGDRVVVSRRNDVIPYVERVTTYEGGPRVEKPHKCPACDAEIVQKGAYLVCSNPLSCPAQAKGAMMRWIKNLDIKELGPAIVDAVFESNAAKSLPGLYTMPAQSWASLRVGGRVLGMSKGTKIAQSLVDTADVTLDVFVGSLGIEMCGRTICKLLMDEGFDTLEKMEKATVDQISGIKGMGPARAESFVDGLKMRDKVISDLRRYGVRIKEPVKGTLTGKSFCFTGFRDKLLERQITEAGGVVKSGVSKKVDFLVAADPEGGGSKVQKAQKLGVSVISRHDAERMI